MDYGKILIYQYLPQKLIPNDFENIDFDELYKLIAMAQIARKMRIEDIEVGVNKGYVEAHPDSQ